MNERRPAIAAATATPTPARSMPSRRRDPLHRKTDRRRTYRRRSRARLLPETCGLVLHKRSDHVRDSAGQPGTDRADHSFVSAFRSRPEMAQAGQNDAIDPEETVG